MRKGALGVLNWDFTMHILGVPEFCVTRKASSLNLNCSLKKNDPQNANYDSKVS